MKAYALIASLSVAAFVGLGGVAQPDLVLNPSFENTGAPVQAGIGQASEIGSANYAGRPGETYWDWGYTNVPNWDRDDRIWFVTDSGSGATAEFPDGDYAYRLDGGLAYGDHRLSQSGIPLAAGQIYDFSLDAWSESATAGQDAYATVDLVGSTSGRMNLLSKAKATADGAYETLTSSFRPNVTEAYTLEIYSEQGQHLWVDNVDLVESPTANLVLNPSFENTGAPVQAGIGQASEIGSANYAGRPGETYWDWGYTNVPNWDRDDRIWFVTDSASGATAEFPDGDYAYRLDGGLAYGDHRLSQSGIPLAAGQIYDFSIDAWSESATAGQDAYATVDLVGSTSGRINLLSKVNATADGVYETLTASFRPTVTETYTLEIYSDQGQHLWVDNVDLVASATANLILNPSFENTGAPVQAGIGQASEIGSANYAGRPGETYWDWGYTNIPNWDRDDRIWFVTDSASGATAAFPDGDYAYRLDGGLAYGDHRLSQSGIPLAAGQAYEFSLDAWSESATAGQDAYVTVDLVDATTGSVFTLLDNAKVTADGAYETLTAGFRLPNTDLYTLEIYSRQGPHVWVDNLSLTAVPEPASFGLAALGLFAVALYGWRRKR